MIISTAYLPPVWYMEAIAAADDVLIDKHEHFVKQNIRTRCHILSPNGIQTLIIPVVHNNRGNTAICDIKIANDQLWQRQHWRSLNAAYRRSAFFEFYMDDFEKFYSKRYEYLFDFNTHLLEMILQFIKLEKSVSFTDTYIHPDKEIKKDLRDKCNTGLPKEYIDYKKYMQVFSSKYDFVPGLSIIDLLFNTGPATTEYLTLRNY